MENISLSIGILTWKSHDTLFNTLNSYKNNGLLDMTSDVRIYAQELSREDLSIADHFRIKNIIGSKENIGIGKAFNALIDDAKYDHILILENDWVLCENPHITKKVILESMSAVIYDGVDFMRLRHVQNPGDPLYTRQFEGNEMASPQHLLDAIHWHGKNLANVFPDKIFEGPGYLFTDSKFGNHTNNPFLCSKKFYNDNIRPYSGEGIQLEGLIRDQWVDANYKVAHSTTGLFTHHRMDR
jgi:hypothetical protein